MGMPELTLFPEEMKHVFFSFFLIIMHLKQGFSLLTWINKTCTREQSACRVTYKAYLLNL